MQEAMTTTRRARHLVLGYPFVLFALALLINALVFDITPVSVSLPSSQPLLALVACGCVLVLNHAWLMTATELVRVHGELRATPEEWAASGLDPAQASAQALAELGRAHAAHRNATENTAVFALLVLPFMLVAPSAAAAWLWLLCFAVGRIGHALAYLQRRTDLRGAAMSLSLLGMFGVASNLLLRWVATLVS